MRMLITASYGFCCFFCPLTLPKTTVLAQVEKENLHLLVQEAKEADLLDLLKALQHACAAGTALGDTLCLSLAKVTRPVQE